jgi:hypothetical protein
LCFISGVGLLAQAQQMSIVDHDLPSLQINLIADFCKILPVF